MSYHFLLTLMILVVDCGISSSLKNYTIIIIPASGASGTIPLRPQTHLIDIEQYDEPTELPDIDQFDYLKDREDVSNDREDYIRYVFGKKGIGKASFKNKNVYAEIDKSSELNELDDNDESYDSDDKIVGGVEVDISEYPYQVSYGDTCGGSVIAAKWVITAGHCGKQTFIRAGSKYRNQGTKVNVKNHYIHPGFTASHKKNPYDYDFQVVELEEALKFGKNIQPIKVAHTEDMVIGKVVTVTGWGYIREGGPISRVLRAVRVPIISNESCRPSYHSILTPRMFCAGFAEGKKDSCQGDSGGPAASGGRLVGVVSFGHGCARPGGYGVYSKVAKVRDWIEDITGLTLD